MSFPFAACEEAETTPASAIEMASPFQYPIELWDRGVEGATLLLVHVNDVGAVDSVYVQETSGFAAFDSAALAGARMLQFRPARRGDKRIDSWVRLPVRFNVGGEPAPAEPQT